ncbi:thyrostimulin alpha-2 subunit [Rhopalosiphum padi]|uniref:thyrostimulin alpha-2 subunit n=1 Tax=Rhopalosiphum padi TaxID=40932 RepID=UPI00298D6EF9|nr:thyrostimulin alpha-2 subunit [Rhopalosiphum padi]
MVRTPRSPRGCSVPCSARGERTLVSVSLVQSSSSSSTSTCHSFINRNCRSASGRRTRERSSLKANFSDMDKFRWWKNAAMIFIFFLAILPSPLATGSNTWQKPGCHKVGHTRKISIPNCVEFPITTNACRGYCESWAVPSPADTVMINPHQRITSVGQCCNIMDTENVEVNVRCLEGVRKLVFKSALSCSCYHCKKE